MSDERAQAARELARAWLDRAQADLRVAMLTDDERIEPEILAFHSQQAAEKALKAVLVLQQIDFPRTHDLGLLLEMCSAAGCTETETLQPATGLTRYAVATRYPGDHERLSRDDAHVAGELAAGVLAWAEARIA